jgi:ubiquinone/menaquinone biosynthesis C-methylase UbiE
LSCGGKKLKSIYSLSRQYGLTLDEAKEYSKARQENRRLILDELKELKLGTDVLECATGDGFLTNILSEILSPKSSLCSIEIDIKMIRKTKERLGGQRVALIEADFSFLPFSNEIFDTFVSESTFHELQIGFGEASRSLMEIVRVLKSGGKLIIIDKLATERKDLTEYQLELLEHDVSQELANRRLWGFHDVEDYISLFENIGLENIKHKILRPKSYRAFNKFARLEADVDLRKAILQVQNGLTRSYYEERLESFLEKAHSMDYVLVPRVVISGIKC